MIVFVVQLEPERRAEENKITTESRKVIEAAPPGIEPGYNGMGERFYLQGKLALSARIVTPPGSGFITHLRELWADHRRFGWSTAG